MAFHLRAVPDPDDGPDRTPGKRVNGHSRLDPDDTHEYDDDPIGDVLVDVDGDGTPDRITTGGQVAKRTSQDVAVPDDDQELVPVDQPAARSTVLATVLADETADRKPVLPMWASDWHTFTSTVRRAALYGLHVAAWHAVRLPWHAALLLTVFSPRGVYRATGAVRRWVADTETGQLQNAAANRGDHEASRMHLALTRQRRNRSGWRWMVLSAAFVAAAVLTAVDRAAAPSWGSWGLVVVAVLVLARLGRNPDQALFGHAVVKAEAPKLTSVVIAEALANLGLAALSPTTKRTAAVQFVSEIAREGAGYRAELDLPMGATAVEVIDRRERLSANLRRPLGCVWPERAPDAHEGRLILWVGDRDLSKGGPALWPLTRKGACSFFAPFPFGTDPRGRQVAVELFEGNVLIGSAPGQGKTATVRVVTSAAALDPLCELWVHELKGSGDLDAYERVAHRFVSGIRDEAIAYAGQSLTLLRKEVERRTDALKAVPAELRPDKKLTPQIAATARFNLRPLVAIFDECQNLFTHAEYGKKAAEDAEYVIKLGRAVGVVLVLATQRPDAKSLPGGIADNVSIRFCLHVNGQIANDMVLGTSSYQEGIRATQFRFKLDAGIGWLKGAGPAPVVAKAFYIDGPAAEQIAERALVLRRAAGTVTGHAAGAAPEELEDGDRIVVDVLRVWSPGEDAMWSEQIAARLYQLDPDRWPELEGDRGAVRLGDLLRARGIEVKDRHRKVEGRGVTRKGVALADLEGYLQGLGRALPTALPDAERPAIEASGDDR